jgi:hypothetical protein
VNTSRLVLIALTSVAIWLSGCSRDQPQSLIDPETVFDRYDWWDSRDRDWYTDRIPFIDTPDDSLNEVYYYRWEVVKTHLTYGSPETGYTFTEFIDRPFWSGKYGGIACPLGHQLSEVRWLKDPRIIDDFARYWIDTDGALPRNYSNWYGSSVWQIHELWGDEKWIVSMLPRMEQQIDGWFDERYDAAHGLFHWTGHADGMEVNINSRQAEDDWVVEGYRPTLNSYLYGDLLAASRTAAIAGDAAKATEFAGKARTLKMRVLDELWDLDRSFFFHQWVDDHPPGIKAKTLTHQTGPYAGSTHGRELIGYVPWQFNLPNEEHAPAWQFLMDTTFFKAPFGPTTAERNDPLFRISPNCCVWSGQSWPYATTQTLVAMANLLNNYNQNVVDKSDYNELLRMYTRTQYKDGRPYVAESANPLDGSWFGSDMPNHSEHYFHSGYVDLVLGGLLGIRPAAGDTLEINPLVPDKWDYFAVEGVQYHGRDLSFYWDADGSRYHGQAGFTVLLDGDTIFHGDSVKQLILPVSRQENSLAFERRQNVAVNNGVRFPEVTASFSYPSTPLFYVHDGGIWYHKTPTNRWTSEGSPNEVDTVTVDFGVAQTIDELRVYFIDDSTGIVPPASFSVEVRVPSSTNGLQSWVTLKETKRTPNVPTGRRANHVFFDAVDATGIRVLFHHAESGYTGLSELEVWTPAGTSVRNASGRPSNLALNTDGDSFPRVTASFPESPDELGVLVDGSFGLTTYQANRWVPRNTPNATDWIQIEFEQPHVVSRVDAYLWGSAPRYLARVDTTVTAPKSLRVTVRVDGAWRDIADVSLFPDTPQTMAVNAIRFKPITADAVRLHVEHSLPAVTGLTEVQVW